MSFAFLRGGILKFSIGLLTLLLSLTPEAQSKKKEKLNLSLYVDGDIYQPIDPAPSYLLENDELTYVSHVADPSLSLAVVIQPCVKDMGCAVSLPYQNYIPKTTVIPPFIATIYRRDADNIPTTSDEKAGYVKVSSSRADGDLYTISLNLLQPTTSMHHVGNKFTLDVTKTINPIWKQVIKYTKFHAAFYVAQNVIRVQEKKTDVPDHTMGYINCDNYTLMNCNMSFEQETSHDRVVAGTIYVKSKTRFIISTNIDEKTTMEICKVAVSKIHLTNSKINISNVTRKLKGKNYKFIFGVKTGEKCHNTSADKFEKEDLVQIPKAVEEVQFTGIIYGERMVDQYRSFCTEMYADVLNVGSDVIRVNPDKKKSDPNKGLAYKIGKIGEVITRKIHKSSGDSSPIAPPRKKRQSSSNPNATPVILKMRMPSKSMDNIPYNYNIINGELHKIELQPSDKSGVKVLCEPKRGALFCGIYQEKYTQKKGNKIRVGNIVGDSVHQSKDTSYSIIDYSRGEHYKIFTMVGSRKSGKQKKLVNFDADLEISAESIKLEV